MFHVKHLYYIFHIRLHTMLVVKHMTQKSKLGKLGEDIASAYLYEKGYKIIQRNYRQKWGEIDIIAKAPDKTIAFIEVKTMFGVEEESGLVPEDHLTKAKLEKLKRTARLFAVEHGDLVDEQKGWQLDLVAITVLRPVDEHETLTNIYKDCVVKHYENIS